MALNLENLNRVYQNDFNYVYTELIQQRDLCKKEIKTNNELKDVFYKIKAFIIYNCLNKNHEDIFSEFIELYIDIIPNKDNPNFIFWAMKEGYDIVYNNFIENNKKDIKFQNIIYILKHLFEYIQEEELLNKWFCRLLEDFTDIFCDAINHIQKFSSNDFKQNLQEYIDSLFLKKLLNINTNIENDELLKNLINIGAQKEKVLKKLLTMQKLNAYYAYKKLILYFKTYATKEKTVTELKTLNFWFDRIYKEDDLLFLLNEGADSNRNSLIKKLKHIETFKAKQKLKQYLLSEKENLEIEKHRPFNRILDAKIDNLKKQIISVEIEINQYTYNTSDIGEIFQNILAVSIKENLNYRVNTEILNSRLKHIIDKDYFNQENNIKNLLKAGVTDTYCIDARINKLLDTDLNQINYRVDYILFLIGNFIEYGIDVEHVNRNTNIRSIKDFSNTWLNQIIKDCGNNIDKLKNNEKRIRTLLIYGASPSSIDNIMDGDLGKIQESLKNDNFEIFKFFVKNFEGQNINLDQTIEDKKWNKKLYNKLNSWSEKYCNELTDKKIDKSKRDECIDNIKFLLNKGATKIILSNNNIFNLAIFGHILKKEIQNINASPVDTLIEFLKSQRNNKFISCLDIETKNNLREINDNAINYYLNNQQ